MNLGKAGEELRCLADNGGELEIDFDGDSAYSNHSRVFFKPAGAFVHFIIDYIKANEKDQPENVFYATIQHKDIDGFEKGRYWLFIYEVSFQGFQQVKSYEYIMVREDNQMPTCMNETQRKQLFQRVKNGKMPKNAEFDNFDKTRMISEDSAETRKEELSAEAMGKNEIKIGSRIQAIKSLSDLRVRNLEDYLTIYQNFCVTIY